MGRSGNITASTPRNNHAIAMSTLFALVVAAITVSAIALPPAVLGERDGAEKFGPPNDPSYDEYYFQRFMRSLYVPTIDRTRIPYKPRPQQEPPTDWLNKEIDHIKQMTETSPQTVPSKPEFVQWKHNEPYNRIMAGSSGTQEPRSRFHAYYDNARWPSKTLTLPINHPKTKFYATPKTTQKSKAIQPKEQTTVFALTPKDAGYFEGTENYTSRVPDLLEGPHEGGGHQDLEEINPRRESRQHPFVHRKTLVADDVGKLKNALDSDKPDHIRVLGSQFATGTVYAVGIAMGVGTAVILAIIGFIFGWYALSKRAKAAADVDYPAYGVTGPTMDTSGDRKLAHSAQMYHYQHQKQQIIAMERTHADQRNGSVSEPASEDENEEGDYTVYECPGFATTGVMEVRNPMFEEDAAPASPGKTEEVKPQHKE